MKKTIVSTNWLNKVIAIMMMMSITFAMPAMAGQLRCQQDFSPQHQAIRGVSHSI